MDKTTNKSIEQKPAKKNFTDSLAVRREVCEQFINSTCIHMPHGQSMYRSIIILLSFLSVNVVPVYAVMCTCTVYIVCVPNSSISHVGVFIGSYVRCRAIQSLVWTHCFRVKFEFSNPIREVCKCACVLPVHECICQCENHAIFSRCIGIKLLQIIMLFFSFFLNAIDIWNHFTQC